jgi:hypothetical protein
LDGPLPKLCPAVTLSHRDGRHSAVALLLKAALIQVSDYRLLGASGIIFIKNKLGEKIGQLKSDKYFLDHLFELLPSLGVRRPSVNFFKNLLL